MKHLLTSASVLALTTLPHAALAQDAFDLGTITVSASQTPTAAERTGTTVEIVTEEDLKETPATRTIEQLDYLPGVAVSSTGGVGGASNISLRGLPARYVGVYFDGIDISDPSGPQTQFSFGALTSAGVGRIEVLKGSQSAIYGSEAIGGVVNITSRRATEMGTTYFTDFEIGSYNTVSATFGVATKSENGELALTINHLDTDGFSAADENNGNTEADGYSGTTLILTGAYQATERVRLGFAFNYTDSTTEEDGGFPLADSASIQYSTRLGARVYAEVEGDTIDHTFALSYSDTERFYPLGFSKNFNGERTEASYKGVTQVGAVELAFGGSYSEETYDVDAATGSYELASIFAEAKYAATDDIDVSLALRHDDHSTFGGFTTGRVAASWQLSADTTVRAAIGTGFRAPSLYELFGPFGNAALNPEESRSAEIGIEHRYGSGAFVKATAFYTEIDNLIGFAGPGYNQIPGTSRSRGFEFSGKVALATGYDLFGSYTYTDAVDQNGNQLLRVPEHDFVVGIDAEFTDRLSGQLVVNHVAGRAAEFGTVMGDYTLVNAAVSYDFTETTQGYVRIENLTNEEYQSAANYGTSDRAVFFGVRASF